MERQLLSWLLFSLCCSIFPTDAELIYVKPSGTDESNGCPAQPCLMLRDYANEASQYFQDNTTFKFLPGLHYLEDPIQLTNISNIALVSSDYRTSTSIFLGLFANISWTNCCNIKISGLIFGLSSHVQFKVRFHFSVLILHSTVDVSISQLVFFGIQSTAIKILSSQVNFSDLTISGATGHSGAVLFASNSTLFFQGLNWFSNNTAREGGAMAFYNSVSVFHGHAIFLNNTATARGTLSTFMPRGGAIFCNNSIISIKGSAIFKQNRAIDPSGFGGAIAAVSGSNLTFHSSANALFTLNSANFMGGALSISSASKLLLQGQVLFEANSANNWGGAIAGYKVLSIHCIGTGIKFQNNSAIFGGAFVSSFSKDVRLKKIIFEDNVAKAAGGAVYHTDGSYLQISKCGFVNNTASNLAGVAYISNSTAAIFEGGYFKWNSGFMAGAIAALYTNITFRNDNLFINNNAVVGPGCLRISSSNALFDGNSIFRQNHGGGISGIFSHLSIKGRASFVSNSVDSHGGGIRILNGTINITGQAIFDKNIAKISGSALYILSCTVVFSGNITVMSGILSSYARIQHLTGSGAVVFISSKVIFGGTLIIANNSDSGIISRDSKVCIEGCAIFLINWRQNQDRGGAIFARNSKIILRDRHNCSRFQGNAASVGGAIFAIDSSVELSGSQIFMQNLAERGGGLAFSGNSKLTLNKPFTISFVQNSALYSGGAIYYEDTFSISQCARLLNLTSAGPSDCFIAINSTLSKQKSDYTRLIFTDNTAGRAGAVLYGGSLENCKLYIGGGIVDNCGNIIGGQYSHSPIHSILEISNIISGDNMTSDISSDPFQICFCAARNSIVCKNQNVETVRGREFTLVAVVVGQNKGIVPSAVRTSLDNDLKIAHSQRVQGTGRECTPISYRLSTSKNSTNLMLFPDGPCRDIEFSRRIVHVSFLPCPDAFMLEGSNCVCEDRLQRYISSKSCNVDNGTIIRSSNTFWIGTVYRDNETYEGLLLHAECPFDFCIDTPVSVQLDNLNIQCDHNRSGILCGSCISNYSIALGTLHCLPCSNIYLALLVPFAFAGIVLVTILLLLRLSVAFGTVNGLIFYANIVQANYAVFFPPGKPNVLIVFISWVNLDLGFETCLYDGMTTFVYTWLQFSFPFYLWFLIGLMIIMSRHSVIVARAIGKNPVAALATLFLLSYSKLIRTIIFALSFTSLEYPNGIEKLVWLYDANIPYFRTVKHVFLGVFALLVLVFLFLPYTLLLLCGQWLQAYSHWRILSWLNKLKPFMDAYHAPYKKETRYWTGLLLIMRCALFLTFTFNAAGNASVNLLAITSVTAGLIVLAWLHKRIYKRAFNDILEGSFILNLCIFSAATYYLKESSHSQTGLAYTSVGIAFTGFICILLYHVYVCLSGIAERKLPKPSTIKLYALNKLTNARLCRNNEARCPQVLRECDTVKLPTVSVVELQESLLY